MQTFAALQIWGATHSGEQPKGPLPTVTPLPAPPAPLPAAIVAPEAASAPPEDPHALPSTAATPNVINAAPNRHIATVFIDRTISRGRRSMRGDLLGLKDDLCLELRRHEGADVAALAFE